MQNPNIGPSQPIADMITKNKSHWTIVVAVIILVTAFFMAWWYIGQMNFNLGPMTEIRTPSDSEKDAAEEAQISNSLNGVDVGNVDPEFKAIDSDLNSL